MQPASIAEPDVLAHPIDQAVRISGLGRTTIYKLAAEGRLRKFNIGKRALIDAASLRALLSGDL